MTLNWFRLLKKLTGKCYKSPARNRLQLRLREVTREMITKRRKAKSGIGINPGKDMTLGKIHARKMSGFLSRKGLTREGGSRTRSERQEIATAAAAAPVFSSFEAISIFKLHCHYFSKLLLDPFFNLIFYRTRVRSLLPLSLTHLSRLDWCDLKKFLWYSGTQLSGPLCLWQCFQYDTTLL